MGTVLLAATSATRRISRPRLGASMSSMALPAGVAPVVLMPMFCARATVTDKQKINRMCPSFIWFAELKVNAWYRPCNAVVPGAKDAHAPNPGTGVFTCFSLRGPRPHHGKPMHTQQAPRTVTRPMDVHHTTLKCLDRHRHSVHNVPPLLDFLTSENHAQLPVVPLSLRGARVVNAPANAVSCWLPAAGFQEQRITHQQRQQNNRQLTPIWT